MPKSTLRKRSGHRRFHGLERLETRHLLAGHLVAHWNANDLNDSFEDGETVDSWLDQVSGITATAFGEPSLGKDAIFGRSVLRFDPAGGDDSFRVAADENPLSGAGDFTVSVVFATDQPLNNNGDEWFQGMGLVDTTVFNGLTPSWGLSLNQHGQVLAGLGGPAVTLNSTTGDFNDGLAHAAIYRRMGDSIDLYVDGGPGDRMDGLTTSDRGSFAMRIGAVGRGGDALDGNLADIRLYDGALTDQEIQELFDQLADKYISPVYDPAIGVADEYLVDAETGISIDAALGVLANDINIDDLLLSATIAQDVSDGTLDLKSDGAFSYDPEGFTGTATFQYLLNDSVADQNTVTVTLLVDTVPNAADDSYVTQEESILVIADQDSVLINDFDAEGDSFTARLVEATSHGTVELASDGTFTYQPNKDFFGADSFTYSINDGDQISAPATVSINVEPVNDAPVAVQDGYYLAPSESLNIGNPRGVLQNDFDVDSAHADSEPCGIAESWRAYFP